MFVKIVQVELWAVGSSLASRTAHVLHFVRRVVFVLSGVASAMSGILFAVRVRVLSTTTTRSNSYKSDTEFNCDSIRMKSYEKCTNSSKSMEHHGLAWVSQSMYEVRVRLMFIVDIYKSTSGSMNENQFFFSFSSTSMASAASCDCVQRSIRTQYWILVPVQLKNIY